MTKLVTSLAVTAVLSFGAVGCKSEVARESQDVEEARQDLREEKQDLQEEQLDEQEEVDEARIDVQQEQRELQAAMTEQIGDAEERYNDLVQQLIEVKGDTAVEPGPGIEQARTQAESKLQAAKTAENPEQTRLLLQEVEQALDMLEQEIDQFEDRA